MERRPPTLSPRRPLANLPSPHPPHTHTAVPIPTKAPISNTLKCVPHVQSFLIARRAMTFLIPSIRMSCLSSPPDQSRCDDIAGNPNATMDSVRYDIFRHHFNTVVVYTNHQPTFHAWRAKERVILVVLSILCHPSCVIISATAPCAHVRVMPRSTCHPCVWSVVSAMLRHPLCHPGRDQGTADVQRPRSVRRLEVCVLPAIRLE